VASQKSGPVASDVPRFARQHTNIAQKEPETLRNLTVNHHLSEALIHRVKDFASQRQSIRYISGLSDLGVVPYG
jgi:hypothetical protein